MSGLAIASLLLCLICGLCHRKKKYTHQRQFTLNRSMEPASESDHKEYSDGIRILTFSPSISGLNSSQRQLQPGSNQNLPTIPPPPPHICITASPSRLSNHHNPNMITVGEVGSLFRGVGSAAAGEEEDTLSSNGEEYDEDDVGMRHGGDLL